MTGFSHIDEEGRARMVDVAGKDVTQRRAVAGMEVRLSAETFKLLTEQALPKGDALATARIAGIQAGKQTAQLIPLCHPLPLSYLDVSFGLDEANATVRVKAEARTADRTGVEMEAMTAASVAALALYDMCKAVQKDIVLSDLKLLYKCGGKSGEFKSPAWAEWETLGE
ncbi:MAG: cyclic pyranopterin monophosphate synthase MoaC [Oceanidesulfovibrio sp.]